MRQGGRRCWGCAPSQTPRSRPSTSRHGRSCSRPPVILQFRARVGPFRQSVKHTRAEHVFQQHIRAWRAHLATGSDLILAEYESEQPAHVFKHGQVRPAPARWGGWGGCLDAARALSLPAQAPRDDFYSPMPPQHYMAFRVEPTLQYFRARVVHLARSRSLLQVVVVGCSLGAGLLAAACDRAAWLSALLAVVGSSAWTQASQYGRFLSRSLGSVRELKDHQQWWESLVEDEQADPDNINHLVQRGEQIITSEWLLGKSAAVELAGSQADADPPAPTTVTLRL